MFCLRAVKGQAVIMIAELRVLHYVFCLTAVKGQVVIMIAESRSDGKNRIAFHHRAHSKPLAIIGNIILTVCVITRMLVHGRTRGARFHVFD